MNHIVVVVVLGSKLGDVVASSTGSYSLRVVIHVEVGRELGGLVADELCGGDLAYLDNIGVANELLLQTLTTVGLEVGCVPDAER